jgi:hypothetical protein
VNFGSTTQLTFSLGGLLGQDMALERLRTLDASAGTNLEALFGAALGFHFRHNNSFI